MNNVPDDAPPVKLRGWTVAEWGRPLKAFGILSFVLAGLSGVCYILVGGTAERVPWWLYVIFGAMGLNLVAGLYFHIGTYVKAIRESRAGYTTTAMLYPELPQLNQDGTLFRTAAERAEFISKHQPKSR